MADRFQVEYVYNVTVAGNVKATRYVVRDTKTGKLVGKNHPPYYKTSSDARDEARRRNQS